MTPHIIGVRPEGGRVRCLQHPAYCAQCADELVQRLSAEERLEMATVGREASWDADGREVEA